MEQDVRNQLQVIAGFARRGIRGRTDAR